LATSFSFDGLFSVRFLVPLVLRPSLSLLGPVACPSYERLGENKLHLASEEAEAWPRLARATVINNMSLVF
jgi:hypothetical protein